MAPSGSAGRGLGPSEGKNYPEPRQYTTSAVLCCITAVSVPLYWGKAEVKGVAPGPDGPPGAHAPCVRRPQEKRDLGIVQDQLYRNSIE